jgi:ATP-dependent DNA helicase RecG
VASATSRGAPRRGVTGDAASALPGGLDTPIERSGLPGATTLRRHGRRLGVASVRDLLTTFPHHYLDRRDLLPIGRLDAQPAGSIVTVRATVRSLRVERTHRRRLWLTTATLEDASGQVEAIWFGRRFIERQLKPGDAVVASGKVRLQGWRAQLDNPDFQRDDGGPMLHVGRIVPVYRLTRGLTARTLRQAIRAGLDRFGPYPEYLDPAIVAGQPSIGQAVEAAHYPDDFGQRDAAVHRLAHDELLALQVGMVSRRRQRRGQARPGLLVSDAVDRELREAITAGLSQRVGSAVALTEDQQRALDAVREDVAGGVPMLRLIQGDVGSGKTAVAAYALALAARSGGQAALLAPTDLLARQLAGTVGDLLEAAGVPVTLLTGSLSAAGRRSALEAIAGGLAPVVVGTHALLQASVAYARLELVVVDEQHRFGVAQREALAAKGASPHVLLMTATPIPRTLGQVLYADLDVTDLRSAPSGRVGTRTGIRPPSDLAGTWGRVREEAAAGHRTFVVVPHIDPLGSDDGPAAGADRGRDGPDALPPSLPGQDGLPPATGAEEVAERLRTFLAPLRIGLVHGRLRADDRDAEMSRFRDGQLDVLVGTTVVEVGVDVPEATMMVVLNADHFGLSQLHQLRGRVGRGSAQSYCVLVADVPADSVAAARLAAVVKTNDGFVLAEQDWALRREGDVLGLAQSGLPRLRLASLARPADQELAVRCRAVAEAMLDDEGLLRPEHAAFAHELERGWLSLVAAGEGVDEEAVGA